MEKIAATAAAICRRKVGIKNEQQQQQQCTPLQRRRYCAVAIPKIEHVCIGSRVKDGRLCIITQTYINIHKFKQTNK